MLENDNDPYGRNLRSDDNVVMTVGIWAVAIFHIIIIPLYLLLTMPPRG